MDVIAYPCLDLSQTMLVKGVPDGILSHVKKFPSR